jgi:hypothetical protein
MEEIRDYWPVKVMLVKRHTHYPAPSNVAVSKELGKILFVLIEMAVDEWI